MNTILQKKVKELFWKFGVDIKRRSVAQNPSERLMRILENHAVNLILDIGANSGQFGLELRKMGYRGKIVSFEPLSTPYDKLLANSKKDKQWTVAPRCAIGNQNGEIIVNIAGNSAASSSIFEMMDTHVKAAPATQNIGTEITPIRSLDSISQQFTNEDSVVFIKIDTQGYEDEVINGGLDTIYQTNILQLELSLVELYKGQKLFLEMVTKISSLGFELWGIEPAFIDPNDGRMLQVDAIFLSNKRNNI